MIAKVEKRNQQIGNNTEAYSKHKFNVGLKISFSLCCFFIGPFPVVLRTCRNYEDGVKSLVFLIYGIFTILSRYIYSLEHYFDLTTCYRFQNLKNSNFHNYRIKTVKLAASIVVVQEAKKAS